MCKLQKKIAYIGIFQFFYANLCVRTYKLYARVYKFCNQ